MSKFEYRPAGDLKVGDTLSHRGEEVTITEMVSHGPKSFSYYWTDPDNGQRDGWNSHPGSLLPIRRESK